MSGDEVKTFQPAEYPLGDILYAYMSLKVEELLLELRQYLNDLGLTITQVTDEHVEQLVEEIDDFLKGNENNAE